MPPPPLPGQPMPQQQQQQYGRAPVPMSMSSYGQTQTLAQPPAPGTGGSQQGAAPKKISAAQMPAPTSINLNQVLKYSSSKPDQNNLPMTALIRSVNVDMGYATPKRMRMTMYTIPTTAAILNTCQIPLAAVLQPFADKGAGKEKWNGNQKRQDKNSSSSCFSALYELIGEADVPLVDFGPSGPLRCRRCGAYMNPFKKFTDNVISFFCKLCDVSNEGTTPCQLFATLYPPPPPPLLLTNYHLLFQKCLPLILCRWMFTESELTSPVAPSYAGVQWIL
jgi:protein transport protein SEC24